MQFVVQLGGPVWVPALPLFFVEHAKALVSPLRPEDVQPRKPVRLCSNDHVSVAIRQISPLTDYYNAKRGIISAFPRIYITSHVIYNLLMYSRDIYRSRETVTFYR